MEELLNAKQLIALNLRLIKVREPWILLIKNVLFEWLEVNISQKAFFLFHHPKCSLNVTKSKQFRELLYKHHQSIGSDR